MSSATANGSLSDFTTSAGGPSDSTGQAAATAPTNGAAEPDPGGFGPDSALLGELFRAIDKGAKGGKKRLHKSWFKDLVEAYLRFRNARRAGVVRKSDGTEGEQALAIIQKACVKAAATGAAAGMLSTGATLVTAETQGVAAIFTVPIAAVAIGGEMFYRSVVHLEMTCDLAELFGVAFAPDNPGELWRVYALAFKTHDHDDDDPGNELVHKVAEAKSEQVGEAIGGKLLGESVLRNVLPFVSIVSSSVQNWRVTKRLGDTVRRYVRYQRALRDALERDSAGCADCLDTLIEGFWFVFTADGHLAEEEAATLAQLYDRFDESRKADLRARFVADEAGFLERCRNLPEASKDSFLHALEVASAVDKEFTLPEQKLLERAAKALGRTFKPQKVHDLMREFEEKGVLAGARHPVSEHRGAAGQPAPAAG